MQSTKVPQFIKIFLAFIITMSALLGSSFSGNEAFAKEKEYKDDPMSLQTGNQNDQKSLAGGFTYSDIYASAIFSESSNKQGKGVASDANIPYETMEKYPTASNSSDANEAEKNAVYGKMTSPNNDEEAKEAGTQFVNIMKTLYKYDWLVPAPKSNEDDGAVSTFFKAVFTKDKQSKTKITMSTLLDTASAGASTYDFFDGTIKKFEGIVTSLKVPDLFKAVTGHGDKHEKGLNNFLTNSITGALHSMGLTNNAIKVLQYTMYGFILFLFVVTLIWAMRNNNAKANTSNVLKRRAIPIIVILMTIPITEMATNVIDDMAESFTKATDNNPNDFNSHYVVDTLQWAATSNLNIGLINPSAEINSTPGIGSMTSFRPTPTRVNNLMSKVNSNAVQAGIGDKHLTAKKLVGQISSQKLTDVNSYLSLISTRNPDGNNAIAASHVNLYNGTTISRGGTNSTDAGGGKQQFTIPDKAKDPMFFFKSEGTDGKAFKKIIEKYQKGENVDSKAEKDITGDMRFRSKNNPAEVGSFAQAARDAAEKENKYPIKWIRITKDVVPFAENSMYSYVNITKSDPSTYIYGATQSGNANKSTALVENYVDGPSNDQKRNMITGAEAFVKDDKDTKKEGKDGKDSDGSKASEISGQKYNWQEDVAANSLRIALMNRYGGITKASGTNVQSFSTQSVSFILQTLNKEGKGLLYNGQNTIPSEDGAKKNSGKNGNAFVRYTIPNTGYGDLLSKAGSINAVWVTSAAVAAIAFLYLLRSPIFGSIIKMFKSYLAALFTGSLAGLLTYIVFYAVIRASFMFARAAILLGSTIATSIVDGFGSLNAMFSSSGLIPQAANGVTIFVIVLCLAMCWPIAEMTIGGKQKKTSIIGIVILLPYIIGEALEDSFNQLQSNITGKRPGSGLLAGRMRGMSAKESVSTVGSNVAKAGAGAAMIGTGTGMVGAGLGAGIKGASSLGRAGLGKLTSRFATMVGDNSSNQQVADTIGKDGEAYDKDGNPLGKRSDRLKGGLPLGENEDKDKNAQQQDDTNLNENQDPNDQNGLVYAGNGETHDEPDEERNADNIEEKDENTKDAKDGEDGVNAIAAHNGTKDEPDEERNADNIENSNETKNESSEDSEDATQAAVAKTGDKGGVDRKTDGGDNSIENNTEQNNQEVNNENVNNENIVNNNGEPLETKQDGEQDVNIKDSDVEGSELPDKDLKANNLEADNASVAKSQEEVSEVKDAQNINQDTQSAQTDQQDVKDQNVDRNQTDQAAVNKSAQDVSEVKDAHNINQETQNDQTANQQVNDESVGDSQAAKQAVKNAQTSQSNVDKPVDALKDLSNLTPRQEKAVAQKTELERIVKSNEKSIVEKQEKIEKLEREKSNPGSIREFKNINPNNIDKQIDGLKSSIEKSQNNIANAKNRIQGKERIIKQETIRDKTTNTINNIKESNTVKEMKTNTTKIKEGTTQIVKGSSHMAGAGRDFMSGRQSNLPNQPKTNNSNTAQSLDNRRQSAEMKRQADRQDQQLREMKKLNQNLKDFRK